MMAGASAAVALNGVKIAIKDTQSPKIATTLPRLSRRKSATLAETNGLSDMIFIYRAMDLTQVIAMLCGFAAQNPQYVRAKSHYLSEMHRPKMFFGPVARKKLNLVKPNQAYETLLKPSNTLDVLERGLLSAGQGAVPNTYSNHW